MVEPGTVVAEHYAVREPIASGAMSLVFRGEHTGDQHPVAIKVLLPEFARDTVAVQRFMREARAAQRIEHPHVVKVEHFGLVDDGRPCVVMELLLGETLEARIQQRRLSPEEVLTVVKQVASALDAAHAAGVVHRDMKPANCFMATEADGVERVKVLDFGFAKMADHLASADGIRTASNALLGTPLYMSPEQIRSSRDVDHRTDIWSLAVMTYELLTGDPPFHARAMADLFVEILSLKIEAPTAKSPELPAAVDLWSERALVRDPARRFGTAGELSDALDAALRAPEAKGASEAETPRPGRVQWARWALALALALAALALGLRR